jgi:GR25 family glycosyltransferase involved in LPS biosynthesis
VKSLDKSYINTIDKAYIIRIKGNSFSENHAKAAADSCSNVGMRYEFWDAYDGTSGEIIPPESHGQVMSMIKLTCNCLSPSEASCVLSHISLWAKCIEIDQPIVVLEHDARMLKPYASHEIYNAICYLGCSEQAEGKWGIKKSAPKAFYGPNFPYICRTHAYSVDPAIARKLLAHVIVNGVCAPPDMLIKSDLFAIYQDGLVAAEMTDTQNTISGRNDSPVYY